LVLSLDCFKRIRHWVLPVEVEGVLVWSAHVRGVEVVEGFDEHRLSCVCAVVVKRNDGDAAGLIEDEFRALCETALPRFKQPRQYVFMSGLPYTATGKVQRFKLREQLRSHKVASLLCVLAS